MKEIKFNESSVTKYFLNKLKDEKYPNIENETEIPTALAKSIFQSIVTFLWTKKKKENPVVLRIDNNREQFLLGCRIEIEKNETTDNIAIEFISDENDINDNDVVISYRDQLFMDYFILISNSEYNFGFPNETIGRQVIEYMIMSIYKTLDDNAIENEEVILTLPGFFTGRVGVENGEKIFAFEVDANLKTLAKDDKLNEK